MATGTQVSHGLNLVLELRPDIGMGQVLQGIQARQDRIDAGLNELNFVHFARFLPTRDGKALQVITEFDGPLAPYVLDFAIEIGDVFDMLLGATIGTEHIVPIAEHPAEFLAFVEKNNQVTTLDNTANPPAPIPLGELNLYSAYPDKTVLDVMGARTELPIPKADRALTPVDMGDAQGNLLKSYRAARVKHLLLRVDDATAARAWLIARATGATSGLPMVTSAAAWEAEPKPDLMLNLGLSAAGLAALGVRDSWRAPLPQAFTQGALARAAENFDVDANAPTNWWVGGPGTANDVHLMVSLYQRAIGPQTDTAFDQAAAALTASLTTAGLSLVDSQEAATLEGRGLLGYADGIAQPRVAGIDTAVCTDLQPAATAGEFLLGASYRNIYGGSALGALPAALMSGGTFCAVRVLKQDKALFDAALRSEAARAGVPVDWLAAKLMGRWFDGAPVSLYPDRPPADPAENTRNDFDYAPSREFPSTLMDHTGQRCPVGAHIRRVNARSSRIAGARYTRRLIRRGMSYQRMVDGAQEEGVFGMFVCADLERQFEFIQRQWINGDRFAPGIRGARDPFAGTPEGGIHLFDIPMPDGRTLQVRLPQFVHTRGSLYLFLPGMAALRQLEHFATTEAPTAGNVGQPKQGEHT